MATSGTAKVCVLCGEDCASKQRTKDNKGRYYCKGCYDKATAARPKPSPALVLPDAPIAEPAHFLDELVSAAPPPVASIPCGQCGYAVPQGSFICTHCGFNAQTGRAMTSKIMKAPKTVDPNRTAWPIVIGIISIVFGASGAALGALQLIVSFLQYDSSRPFSYQLGRFGGSGLIFSLALWLLVSGIGICRRESSAVNSIKRWAILKLALYTVCLGLLILTLGMSSSEHHPQARPGTVEAMIAGLGVALVLVWAWFAAWPAFVLIWFARSSIQDQVAQWD
jgi:hypothetical protein